jgi:hypothetical protein
MRLVAASELASDSGGFLPFLSLPSGIPSHTQVSSYKPAHKRQIAGAMDPEPSQSPSMSSKIFWTLSMISALEHLTGFPASASR